MSNASSSRSHLLAIATLGALAVATSLTGCVAEEREPGGDLSLDTLDTEDALIGVTCSEEQARRFDAVLESGGCESVRGEGGTWIARSLFPDAPADVQDSSCRFTWRGKVAGNPPEPTSLLTAVQGSLIATCARGQPPLVIPGNDEDPPIVQGGSIGCDVCGKNRGRRGWLVIPPNERGSDRIRLRVGLMEAAGPSTTGATTSGDMRFQLDVPRGVSALTLRLPAPPEGFVYRDDSLIVGGF